MDIRTLITINFIYTLIVAVGLAATFTEYAGFVRRSMKSFCSALFLLAAGWLILSIRGMGTNSFYILFGNTIILYGELEIYQSFRIFHRKPTNRKKYFPFLLGVLVLLMYFYLAVDLSQVRILTFSLVSAGLALITAGEILFGKDNYSRQIRYLNGFPYLMLAGLFILRILDEVLPAGQASSWLNPWVVQVTLYAGMLVVTFTMTFGYILLCNSRFNIELKEQAVVDPLSSLYNRRGVQAFLEKEIAMTKRTSNPLALLILDVNQFKNVNDHYGHEAGDEAIKHVAESIMHFVRVSDLAGRIGGDEFVVVLPNTDREEAQTVADRISSKIESTPLIYRDFSIELTVCIGLAVLDDQETCYDDLFLEADKALYRAKNAFYEAHASLVPRGDSPENSSIQRPSTMVQ